MKRADLAHPDGRVSVLAAGPEVGPAVLALPGITCPAAAWAPMAARLAAEGLRVIVVDQRGRGRTTVGRGGYGVSRMAGDTAWVMRTLGLGYRTVVLGHSLGALVAARCAEARRTVLVDPPLCPDGRPYPAAADDYVRMVGAPPTAAEARRIHPDWAPGFAAAWAEALPSVRADAVREAHRDFHDGEFLRAWPALAGARTTLLYGAASDVVGEADAAALRAANPAASVVRVPGAGHMVPFQQPDAVVRAVGAAVEAAADDTIGSRTPWTEGIEAAR
ncbi:alpha/beta hydrolase [Yinghuangia aomiensis]|uniref:Alpha/beta hydrolase n=1 Tax=Yinghuangia aomiensis TaxID=676205 RepID=A0ABP9I4N6_9ACTN